MNRYRLREGQVLAFMDFETSGIDWLSPLCRPLEVGMVITDHRLSVLKTLNSRITYGDKEWVQQENWSNEDQWQAVKVHGIHFQETVGAPHLHPALVHHELDAALSEVLGDEGRHDRATIVSDNPFVEMLMLEKLRKLGDESDLNDEEPDEVVPSAGLPIHYVPWGLGVMSMLCGVSRGASSHRALDDAVATFGRFRECMALLRHGMTNVKESKA